jgi:hypothetical protein
MAYTSRAALTRAAQTGLSCSVRFRVRVLRSVPRRAPVRVHLRTGTHGMWSSPRHDRLDARIVTLTRLQASLHVAARGLAPSEEALDTPLGPHGSHRASGVCYSALRCLPRRDLHPLETNDGMSALARPHRHDATCAECSRTRAAERQGSSLRVVAQIPVDGENVPRRGSPAGGGSMPTRTA